MAYISDRKFTDTVHTNLALPIIYGQLNWAEKQVDPNMLEEADINDGIDYFLIDLNGGGTVSVQERFRESKYRNYNDATIRFEREFNTHADRRLSEFYKIRADYLVYGIINSTKQDVENATDFHKFAVIDLNIIKRLIDSGEIVIDRSLNSRTCVLRNGTIYCPVNQNPDGSSSFIPLDVFMLKDLHPEAIIIQRGYY